MKKANFPILASIVGAFLFVVLIKASAGGEGNTFPVLMLLFMSELGVIITGAGAIYGIKLQLDKGFDVKLLSSTIVCIALAIALALEGVSIWGTIDS